MSVLTEHLLDGSHWGFFGGAFDPPHSGHLELAGALCVAAKLDGVLLVPSFHPPHKSAPKAGFADRMAMCELACANEKSFVISDFESHLPTPGYTVDALSALKSQFPEVRFSILVGADNLRILSSWSRFESLLRMAPLLVGSRPQYQQNIRDDFREAVPEELHDRIRVVKSPLINISSSALRKRLRVGESVSDEIHPDVSRYIQERRLYQ